LLPFLLLKCVKFFLEYYVDLSVGSAVLLVVLLLTCCGCRQGTYLRTTWARVYSQLPRCYFTCSKAKYLQAVAAMDRKTYVRVPNRTRKALGNKVLTFYIIPTRKFVVKSLCSCCFDLRKSGQPSDYVLTLVAYILGRYLFPKILNFTCLFYV